MTTPDAQNVAIRILPAVRHLAALLLTFSGPALMLAALAIGLITKSPLIGGFGLLGGAILTACGGLGLLWSLDRHRQVQ